MKILTARVLLTISLAFGQCNTLEMIKGQADFAIKYGGGYSQEMYDSQKDLILAQVGFYIAVSDKECMEEAIGAYTWLVFKFNEENSSAEFDILFERYPNLLR
jgi:hypothetical protein